MKFYSEKLDLLFDSKEELEKAETKAKAVDDEIEELTKRLEALLSQNGELSVEVIIH